MMTPEQLLNGYMARALPGELILAMVKAVETGNHKDCDLLIQSYKTDLEKSPSLRHEFKKVGRRMMIDANKWKIKREEYRTKFPRAAKS